LSLQLNKMKFLNLTADPYLEELDAKLERSYLDDEDDRPSMVGSRVCYQSCCKKYDSSDIYDIDLEFDKYFGNKPYLKMHFIDMRFTKSHVETLHYTPIRFKLCDAIDYVSNCHCCGSKLVYGEIRELFEWRVYKNLVCSKECETKMKDEERVCFFGKSCKMCDVFSNDGDKPCDCYVCNLDGDDEVNHFNRLHQTCYTSNSYEKLKDYAETNEISPSDAIFYAQSCHGCNKWLLNTPLYGNTYCSKLCREGVEEFGQQCCYAQNRYILDSWEMDCAICCKK
jgi:hypothetical protein